VFGFAGALISIGSFLLVYRWLGNYNLTSWTVTIIAVAGLSFAVKALARVRLGNRTRADPAE
ncbi:MAG: hypothetical protein MUF80_06870, partial [Burkholderiales bacterium]|jgi:hypothetical protein|nr:hypothetical protein [Burkholderiales bacterium]